MENKKQSIFQKVLNILSYVFIGIAVVVMLFTVISVSTFNNTKKNVFGYKLFTVLSDSMKKTDFDAGDVIIVKAVDITTIKVGDIITFQSSDPELNGAIITHKVREVIRVNNQIKFKTYGTTTNTDDLYEAEMIIGKYVGKISNLGHFFSYLKTTPGYILFIFLPFAIILATQGINCVLIFKQYRKEQNEKIEAEKEELRKEREKAQQMLEELNQLKEQLASKSDNIENE